MTLILGVGSVLMAFPACGPRITDANIAVVNAEYQAAEGHPRSGVSPKEVESILGQPQRMETKVIPLETQKKEVELVRYYYEQDGQTIEMHFVDNKLISPVPMLKKMPPPAARTKEPTH